VDGVSDLKAFVDLPYRLHRGTPWMPSLKLERYAWLTRATNPFFTHGEAQLFLARRDGRVVGRISAQIDRAFNDFHQNRWGWFGFLEFEDDQEVVEALLASAEAWLRAGDRDVMVGPVDFQMNQECGVLIEGFELEPMIQQRWNPPHYQARVEQAGLRKAIDVFHWRVEIGDRDTRMLPVLPEIARQSREKHGITIRRMSFLHLRRELDEFAKVYNAAWSHNWGFVPVDEHDLADMAITYRLVFDKDWFMIAENQAGETVAMAITIPDINQVLKRMHGRLLPGGWWHYLNRRRIIDRARIGFLGVLPEYQHTGVAAALYLEHFDTAARTRIKWGEPGWILETNRSMNRGLEAMGARITKTCRVYERPLEPGATAAPPESVRRYVPAPTAHA
jgi:GNAT superfamily N-acetyltransferase